MRSYYETKKYKLFPQITDFTDPQDHLRFRNVNDMTWKEWFWFSPSCYNLLTWGYSIIGATITSGVLIYSMTIKSSILLIISAVLLFVYGKELYKKIKTFKLLKNMNFYDLYLREY